MECLNHRSSDSLGNDKYQLLPQIEWQDTQQDFDQSPRKDWSGSLEKIDSVKTDGTHGRLRKTITNK